MAVCTAITRTPQWRLLAGSAWTDALAVGIHTLLSARLHRSIAWIVYRKLGVAFLRVAWFNLDWLWAGLLSPASLSS